jgi:DNA-binding Xre family transcriptional regulator
MRKDYSQNYATRVNTSKIKMVNLKDVEEMCEFLECTLNKNVADISILSLKKLICVDTW